MGCGGSARVSHLRPPSPPLFLTLSGHGAQVEEEEEEEEEEERVRWMQRNSPLHFAVEHTTRVNLRHPAAAQPPLKPELRRLLFSCNYSQLRYANSGGLACVGRPGFLPVCVLVIMRPRLSP
ncbi:hypothetical protein SprV_0802574300 [Sparganum proliferum]